MAQSTSRIIFNILARDVEKTAAFYETLCGLKRLYSSDWYVVLTPDGGLDYELGVIDADNQVVPAAAQGAFAGGYLTLVVEDIDQALKAARDMGAAILQEPTPLEYGQTQMLVRDPNDVVVDISALTKA